MGIMRKYDNDKLQINPWHHEDEPHNNHKTSGRHTKQLALSSSPSESHDGSNNQLQINNNRTTSSQSHWGTLMYFTGTKSSP